MEDMPSRSEESPEILYRMPERMRKELSRALGPVISGDETEFLRDKFIISVGDVCSITLYHRGIMPHIAILDGKTERSSFHRWKEMKYPRTIKVKNPKSTITRDLWNAIEVSIRSEERSLILVDGEEDLASLPCILMAPEGSYVIYGIPDRGICVVKVDKNAKNKAKEALSKMKTEA